MKEILNQRASEEEEIIVKILRVFGEIYIYIL